MPIETNKTAAILVDSLDADTMLAVFYAAGNKLKLMSFPAIVVNEFDEDEDGETITTLRCPRCHSRIHEHQDDLVVVDWDTRWTTYPSFDFADRGISFDYDGEQNYEHLYYRCAHCQEGVSLPDNWKELS